MVFQELARCLQAYILCDFVHEGADLGMALQHSRLGILKMYIVI